MAHPRDAVLGKCTQRWGSVADHNIERKWRRFSQARNQSDIGQTWREQAVSASSKKTSVRALMKKRKLAASAVCRACRIRFVALYWANA